VREIKSTYIFTVASSLALLVLLSTIIQTQKFHIGLSHFELILKLLSIDAQDPQDFQGSTAATALFGLDETDWHEFETGKVINIQLLGHPRGWCPVVFSQFEVSGAFQYTYWQPNGEGQNWFGNPSVIAYDASFCITRSASDAAGFIVVADDFKQIYLDARVAVDFEQWMDSRLVYESTAVDQYGSFFDQSPEFVRKNFRFGDSYRMYHDVLVRVFSRNLVFHSSGINEENNEALSAVQKALSETDLEGELLGFKGNRDIIVNLSVWILFVSFWVLWRTLRQLNGVQSHDAWIASDVRDFSGRIAAIVFAGTPFVLAFISAIVFLPAMGITGSLFGFTWGVDLNFIPFFGSMADAGSALSLRSHVSLITAFVWWPILFLGLMIFNEAMQISIRCRFDDQI
jgi:hypothetical protein